MTKVTLQEIEDNIIKQEFVVHGLMTLCILTLKNKFNVVGESACVDPAKYNLEKGKQFAREDAIQKCWPLMGYALRTRMARVEEVGEPSGAILLLGSPKTYVGTKVVHAVPMARKTYLQLRGWPCPPNENPEDPGYLVEYTDGGTPNVEGFPGYVSWAPKNVFEISYTSPLEAPAAGDWLVRLQIEHDQISERYKKLSQFVTSGGIQKLPAVEQQDLREQSVIMRDYLAVLVRRITRAKG